MTATTSSGSQSHNGKSTSEAGTKSISGNLGILEKGSIQVMTKSKTMSQQ